jgi:hypothetical protein
MIFHQLKITLAISVYADDMNISVWSGSIDIAVRKLNGATGVLNHGSRNRQQEYKN